MYAVAKGSLMPYNLLQRAPETQKLQNCNIESQPKPNKNNFFHININKKVRVKQSVKCNV